MNLGMIGLGRMGAGIAMRLMEAGISVVGYDKDPEKRSKFSKSGGRQANCLEDLVTYLENPRTIWIMIPAGADIDEIIGQLIPNMEEGDTIIDGGNSYYQDTIRRSRLLKNHGFNMVDVGTSGGIWGRNNGYSLMIGGDIENVKELTSIFEALAPGPEKGWGHVGPNGAGHYVKMIHNGIEYGLMEAYAEGFAVMEGQKAFDLDLQEVADIWSHGSVIRSALLDLISKIFKRDSELRGIAPFVEDSGEGRWTVIEAMKNDVATPVITMSLIERIKSRDDTDFADRMLAALRREFGGHEVKKK